MKGGYVDLGRQVNFFFSQEDEKEFISKTVEGTFQVMDLTGYIIENPCESKLNRLVFALPESRLIYDGHILNTDESEVIIYSRCTMEDGAMNRGRIWAEFIIWNSDDEKVRKSENFEKAYSKMARWIKKNSRINEKKIHYIGSDAYHMYKNGTRMVLTPNSNGEWD